MPKIRTHYDNLQIARNASDAVIKAAYRGLSQQHHPDKNPQDRERAERVMKIINEAYEVLSDPTKRQEHDQWIEYNERNPEHTNKNEFERNEYSEQSLDLVVKKNKSQLLIMLGASVIFAGLGLALFANGESQQSWPKEALRLFTLYISTPMFSLMALICTIQIINPSPCMIINKHGIHAMTFGGANLQWQEISKIEIEEYQGARFLTIFPKEPDIMMNRQSLWSRLATKFNAHYMKRQPAIVISESIMEMSLEQLFTEIKYRREISVREKK